RDLGANGAHDDLRLGLLEERAADGGELAGAVRARVEPADEHAAARLAAVEVRHEPARGADQRRLARRGQARPHDEPAGLDVQRDVAQRGLRGAGVAVAEVLEGQRAHASIPVRLRSGSCASTTIAAAYSHGPAPPVSSNVGYGSTVATSLARPTTASSASAA